MVNKRPKGPKLTPTWTQNGPKMAPKAPPNGPKMAPRWPKLAQDGPKLAQDGPKLAPKAPKLAPEAPKMSPKWAQEGPQIVTGDRIDKAPYNEAIWACKEQAWLKCSSFEIFRRELKIPCALPRGD